MSWVTVAWSALAACCLTLAAQHVLIGARQQPLQNFLFAATCISGAAMAGFELALMRASSAREYGGIMQASHVALFCLLVSLVLFVRVFFRAGRTWLAGAVIGVRSAVLLVNFLRTPNFNYASLSGIRRIPFLGERVSTADGVVSAWGRLGEFGSLLLLAFLTDAAVTVWRRGERRRAVIVGGSMILFVLFAAGHTALVHSRVLDSPYLIAFSYLPIVGAMGYELTSDVLRAARLARDLEASQAALMESERRLALGAEAAGLGFWSWEVSRDVIWMSRTGRALRGFVSEERLDVARFLSSVHPEDRESVRATLDRAARGSGSFEIEYRVVRPDGEVRWLMLRGAGELGKANDTLVRGVSIDTTARKAAEADAERRKAEVAHLSRVTMLGELAGSLAHEVNQPLTAIVSNAQAAQRFLGENGGGAGEVREILTDIVQEGKHASEVIHRLRALMRKDEVVFVPLALGDLLEDVLRLCRAELAAQGVAVAADVAEGLPPVRGDRVQIEQVLLNLVTNGSDAMADTDPSQRLLSVRACAAEDRHAVQVSVSDRGSGVPAAELERIFEPFVTTKQRGLGLGLAVCRSIVEAHDGRLWAVNNETGGATLHFTIPAAPER